MDHDPYKVLVSEFMLQQTRMSAVVPYFERWMERWPDLPSLAAAREEEVLKLWEGLGYYSRCRNLLKAVRAMAAEGLAAPPPDAAKLRAFPGIGEYTAGAVASVAYDLPTPAVDGNAERVVSRLCNIPEPAGSAALRREAARVATEMYAAVRPRELNQALMELGAMVCTPRRADCGACPLSGHCAAWREGTAEQRPLPRVRASVSREEAWGGIFLREEKILLRRRPPAGVWASMWEVPWFPRTCGDFAADLRRWPEGCGITPGGDVRALGTASFSFTTHRVRAWVAACPLSEVPASGEWRLAAAPELDAMTLPAPSRKFLRVFREMAFDADTGKW